MQRCPVTPSSLRPRRATAARAAPCLIHDYCMDWWIPRPHGVLRYDPRPPPALSPSHGRRPTDGREVRPAAAAARIRYGLETTRGHTGFHVCCCSCSALCGGRLERRASTAKTDRRGQRAPPRSTFSSSCVEQRVSSTLFNSRHDDDGVRAAVAQRCARGTWPSHARGARPTSSVP